MSYLLSETTRVPERHSELSGVIADLPVISCIELGRMSTVAMSQFFRENETVPSVSRQVLKVAQGISSATRATLDFIRDETAPEVKIEEHFPGLELALCEQDGKLIDDSIRSILGTIAAAGYFDHGKDDRTYMFRVETGDPSLNIVTELHRFRLPDRHPVTLTRHADVLYDLSIAGYDVVK